MARQKRRQRKERHIPQPKKPRIALIGFRGIGKSAIARRLNEIWHIPLVSLDEKIEAQEGKRIDALVTERGWSAFRDLEFDALKEVSQMERVLLDCGGGIVEEADGLRSARKLELLKANFFCVYIASNEEKMRLRLERLQQNSSRPSLSQNETIDSLMEVFRRREPLYLEIASSVVDVSDTNISESAERIIQLFK